MCLWLYGERYWLLLDTFGFLEQVRPTLVLLLFAVFCLFGKLCPCCNLFLLTLASEPNLSYGINDGFMVLPSRRCGLLLKKQFLIVARRDSRKRRSLFIVLSWSELVFEVLARRKQQ